MGFWFPGNLMVTCWVTYAYQRHAWFSQRATRAARSLSRKWTWLLGGALPLGSRRRQYMAKRGSCLVSSKTW